MNRRAATLYIYRLAIRNRARAHPTRSRSSSRAAGPLMAQRCWLPRLARSACELPRAASMPRPPATGVDGARRETAGGNVVVTVSSPHSRCYHRPMQPRSTIPRLRVSSDEISRSAASRVHRPVKRGRRSSRGAKNGPAPSQNVSRRAAGDARCARHIVADGFR